MGIRFAVKLPPTTINPTWGKIFMHIVVGVSTIIKEDNNFLLIARK